jgi:hypothetical protein
MSRSISWLFAIGAAACGASAASLHEQAARDNPRARDAALARFAHGRTLAPIDLPVIGVAPPNGQTTSTPIGDKGLVAVPGANAAAPALGFAEDACASGDSCHCVVSAEYHAWTEGDRIVIARMVPDVAIHEVKRAGSCGFGCGIQPPPPPVTIVSLGSIDPAKVEIADVHYPYDEVVETCDHPIPAP